jgi:hypothetical protein
MGGSAKYIKNVLKDWKRDHNGNWVKRSKAELAKKSVPKQQRKQKSQNAILQGRVKQCRARTKERINSTPSAGEQKIIDFFMENGVEFIREYYNPKLFNPETGNMLYFDFYVPKYNLLIEFDGIHHFKPVYGEDKLLSQKAKDKEKDRWCRKRDWPLLRISCFEMKDLETILCKAFDKLDPI